MRLPSHMLVTWMPRSEWVWQKCQGNWFFDHEVFSMTDVWFCVLGLEVSVW